MARETLTDQEVFGQRCREVKEGVMSTHLRKDWSRHKEQAKPRLGASVCQAL